MPGCSTNLDEIKQWHTVLAVRGGEDCWICFSLIDHFYFPTVSRWETARYTEIPSHRAVSKGRLTQNQGRKYFIC